MTKLDRRKLLTSGAASAVFASAAMGASAHPRRGGLLRAALSGARAGDSWDMCKPAGLFMMAAAHGAVFETLTEIGADGGLRGELLESWRAENNAQTWRLKLRKDALFHNGKPFVAADVVASLALHKDGAGASPAHSITQQISRIDVKSKHELLLHLSAPNAGFPYQLADYHLVMYPSGDIENAMQNGIGTGLYRVERFDAGRGLHAVRVREHYRANRAGWFDEISLVALNSKAKQTQALQERRVDVGDLARAQFRDGFSNRRIGGGIATGIPLNRDRAPFMAYEFANHPRLHVPQTIGNLWPLDNARFAQRWWMA